jgi:poly(3-hydroxyalkanoate) synthetase
MILSQSTISAIFSALLHEREKLAADLAFWSSRQSRVGKKTHYQQVKQLLQDNATAIAELANGPAPWLKQHPEYPSIIELKETA